jgi:hypothetical protein
MSTFKVGDRISFKDDNFAADEAEVVDSDKGLTVRIIRAAPGSNEFWDGDARDVVGVGQKGWWLAHSRKDVTLLSAAEPKDTEILRPEHLTGTTTAPGAGAKDDQGKLPMHLIPAEVTEALWVYYEKFKDTTSKPACPREAVYWLARWKITGDLDDLLACLAHQLELLGDDSWLAGLPAIAEVLRYGAYERPRADGTKGYGENNWQSVPNGLTRYYSADMRHMCANEKEELDPESGKKHLAHAATCTTFLVYLALKGTGA